MGAPSELGTIAFGVASIEIAVRPLRWRGSSIEMAAGLTLSGGAVYAAAIATRPDVRAREGVDGILGAGLAAEIGWRIDPGTALEVGLGAGYDVLGPRLETPERVVAALRGFRGGLTLAVRLPI